MRFSLEYNDALLSKVQSEEHFLSAWFLIEKKKKSKGNFSFHKSRGIYFEWPSILPPGCVECMPMCCGLGLDTVHNWFFFKLKFTFWKYGVTGTCNGSGKRRAYLAWTTKLRGRKGWEPWLRQGSQEEAKPVRRRQGPWLASVLPSHRFNDHQGIFTFDFLVCTLQLGEVERAGILFLVLYIIKDA
jgi:hypothetical protein